MTSPVAVSLATSTAARMAGVDALAMLAAVVVAVSVVGALSALLRLDRSVERPYRLATTASRSTPRPAETSDVRYAA
jgi:hypothetical protein